PHRLVRPHLRAHPTRQATVLGRRSDMTQTRNSDKLVPTRRFSFGASLQDLPKHFAADGDLIASHVMASLSAVFPDGEDFFVRSVRNFRDRISDPALKRQVA